MPTIQLHTPIPGPKSQAILARRTTALPAGLAKSTEIVVKTAKGAVITDADDNILLDFAGGIGMINAGHSPDTVVAAIKAQADKYLHTCALVTTMEPYIELAEMLNELSPVPSPAKTLLMSSGAEAVENAVNIAKYYTGRNAVIVFEGAYHGRTMLTMSLTSKYALFKKGYGSFASDIYRLPAPNMYRIPKGMTDDDYIDHCITQLENAFIAQVDASAVAAILIEPIQGEGGFIPMPQKFLEKIRQICTDNGILFIADEIQSGFGRTGKLFALNHYNIQPDLITLAKSMGAGLPIAAVVGKAEIMDKPHLGAIGGTYGGSPITCVAAIEAIKIITDPEFEKHSNEIGDIIENTLNNWKEKYNFIGDVRGVGAMRLIEFVHDPITKKPYPELAIQVIKHAVTHGIVLIRAGLYSNCIRLLPPLVITNEQLHEGLQILENAIAYAHEAHAMPQN